MLRVKAPKVKVLKVKILRMRVEATNGVWQVLNRSGREIV